MTTYGFLIDNRRCIGCHACSVACKVEHQVPLGVARTWVKYIEKGVFPETRRALPGDALQPLRRCALRGDLPDHGPLHPPATGSWTSTRAAASAARPACRAAPTTRSTSIPETETAAKCNFCAHKVEVGLEPPCVTVCPTQAIVAGDLDNPASRISTLVGREPIQVRKPEKGTRPKLFYIQGDADALVPVGGAAAFRLHVGPGPAARRAPGAAADRRCGRARGARTA